MLTFHLISISLFSMYSNLLNCFSLFCDILHLHLRYDDYYRLENQGTNYSFNLFHKELYVTMYVTLVHLFLRSLAFVFRSHFFITNRQMTYAIYLLKKYFINESFVSNIYFIMKFIDSSTLEYI